MTSWCVYMHENRVNGKKYIGITKQLPEKRWQNGHGYRECPRFYNAVQRYGWDAFRHEILYTGLTKEEAERLEIDLIEKYNTMDPACGYNLDAGGGGAAPKTAETRAKMSAARCGRRPTPETVERLRKAHLGKVFPAEVRAKMSAAQKGVKKSADHARKIGDAHAKAVVMLSASGAVLAVFSSMTAAEATTGVSLKNMSEVCRGRRKTAGGYFWRYAIEEE